ncbi:MAG: helix-turn-helix domain-containing protein [Lachnospiraceae bacterium]|nr:helix-turn-helix domain-containing protein [Lachnospiraceae bacterium]
MAGQDFGQTLRELRHHKGLTQEAISRELHISRQVYSHYENGRRSPDAVTASRIADFHHIPLQKLVKGLRPEEIPKPDEQQEFVMLYDSLNPEDQESIRGYIEYLHAKIDQESQE